MSARYLMITRVCLLSSLLLSGLCSGKICIYLYYDADVLVLYCKNIFMYLRTNYK